MTKFDTWFDEQDYCTLDGCYQEKYLAAQDAWDEQEERIREVINRLERIYYAPPLDLPPTSTNDFRKVCNDLKSYIDYMKEELL